MGVERLVQGTIIPIEIDTLMTGRKDSKCPYRSVVLSQRNMSKSNKSSLFNLVIGNELQSVAMPHALAVPSSGFQAIILCGPGVSLTTFTANPEDFPKALVPIANRPMVWYPLDWCYRMGITSMFSSC